MYLHGLATKNPDAIFPQTRCAELARGEALASRLNRRSQLILRRVLSADSGVDKRHFALDDVPGVFDYTADQLNEVFRREAPELAARALRAALGQAATTATQLDALFICTCTGYLCPGVSSYVAEILGLRPDAVLHDLTGHGCGAAIPTLRAAHAFLAAHPQAVVATVAVEICSAAFYLDDDPGVLISACLFGDGAAAGVWRGTRGPSGLACSDFQTLHKPENRDQLRFETRNGKLRNLLSPTVPELAAAAVQSLYDAARSGNGRPISRVIAHPGGRDVIDAVEDRLPGFDFAAGRRILREFGNMSSPSVLFVLEESLRDGAPGETDDWWLVSFGAGFSAHACRLKRG